MPPEDSLGMLLVEALKKISCFNQSKTGKSEKLFRKHVQNRGLSQNLCNHTKKTLRNCCCYYFFLYCLVFELLGLKNATFCSRVHLIEITTAELLETNSAALLRSNSCFTSFKFQPCIGLFESRIITNILN